MTRELVILGSTGSIGVQALEIVEANPELFSIVAITSAGTHPQLVIEQAKKFAVKLVGVTKNAEIIRQGLPGVQVVDGPHARPAETQYMLKKKLGDFSLVDCWPKTWFALQMSPRNYHRCP